VRWRLVAVLAAAGVADGGQAHRVVLGAYSDVLASVLGTYNSGEVIRLDLTDFHSEAVVTILRFLYSTELRLACNTVGQVCLLILKDFGTNERRRRL